MNNNKENDGWERKDGFSTPLLKGGKSLSEKFHSLISDQKKFEECEILKRSCNVLSKVSPKSSNGNRIVDDAVFITTPLSNEQYNLEWTHNQKVQTDIEEVRKSLEHHEQKMIQMSKALAKNEKEYNVLHQQMQTLTERTNKHHHLIEAALQKTHNALDQQRLLLIEQHNIIKKGRLEKSDGLLTESVYVCLAMMILSNPTANYILQLICNNVDRKRVHQTWLPWLLRTMSLIYLVYSMRYVNRKIGISQRISAVLEMLSSVGSAIFGRWSKLGSISYGKGIDWKKTESTKSSLR